VRWRYGGVLFVAHYLATRRVGVHEALGVGGEGRCGTVRVRVRVRVRVGSLLEGSLGGL
jgi:hypothetical protein